MKTTEQIKQNSERHPEDYCHICGDYNILWYAPNEIFNKVNGDGNGIMCPLCFMKMAKEKGILDLIFTVERLDKEIEPKWLGIEHLPEGENKSWFFISRRGKNIGSSYTLNQVKDYAKSGIATHFFELRLPEPPTED